MKKHYSTLSVLNFIFGICAIVLYLPYTITAFNLSGFTWLTDIATDMLKTNYFDTLIFFGIFILAWLIIGNILTISYRPNLPKILFKASAIVALILPMVYVTAMKFDWVLEIYKQYIAKNIKMVSLVSIAASVGLALMGLCSNFSRRNRANLHHILQAVVMCAVLVLLVVINGWCGWKVGGLDKLFGILMGLFAAYFPVSAIVLFMLRKTRD